MADPTPARSGEPWPVDPLPVSMLFAEPFAVVPVTSALALAFIGTPGHPTWVFLTLHGVPLECMALERLVAMMGGGW